MGTFWLEALVAAVSATLGAVAVAALTLGRRGHDRVRADEQAPSGTPPAHTSAQHETSAQHGANTWPSRLARCEQAVSRAFRAVDTVSSTTARQGLRVVVRRMEAELPNVRALVELGRGLESGNTDQEAVRRICRQLDEAAARFGALADQMVEAVLHHVDDPDLDKLNTEVAVLRGQFPLLRPMSAVLETPPERRLAEVSA